MDQDIPGCFSRSNDSPEIAWSDYNKSVGGGELYIRPRLFKADVTIRYLDSASTGPDFYLKSLNRSRQLLKQKKKGNNASSDLGSPLKRLKKLAPYPNRNKEVLNADFVARSSEGKKKGNNASMPHEFPPKSSESLALDSEVNNEGENETTSSSSLSKPSKELPLKFLLNHASTLIQLKNFLLPFSGGSCEILS